MMEAEGSRLQREKQQLKIPQEAPFASEEVEALPAESDYLERTSCLIEDPKGPSALLGFSNTENDYIHLCVSVDQNTLWGYNESIIIKGSDSFGRIPS